MMKSLALLCLAGASLLLGGCRTLHGGNACHKSQPYMSASSVAPLQIPQGLDAPDTTGALKLPVLKEPAAPLNPKAPCLDEPPPFKVAKPAPAPQA